MDDGFKTISSITPEPMIMFRKLSNGYEMRSFNKFLVKMSMTTSHILVWCSGCSLKKSINDSDEYFT